MKIYLNAQFQDGRSKTRLLSVGMVSELGEFYRILDDPGTVEHARKDPWLRQHVLIRLPWDEEGRDWYWDLSHPEHKYLVSRDALADDMLDFVDGHTDPEFWGWQSAYDYTFTRHVLGKFAESPANFPRWCGELAAEWKKAGKPELPPRGVSGHHALELARWAMQVDEQIHG